VQLPALRERSDFASLTQRLLSRLQPQRALQLAPALQQALQAYHWPGNVRQYASALRTACAMLNDDESIIDWGHLSDDLLAELRPAPGIANPSPSSANPDNALSLDSLSRLAIQQALERHHGNVSLTAKRLGISRQTLYRKLALSRSRP